MSISKVGPDGTESPTAKADREDGFVLAFAAIALTVLMAVGGAAVDLGAAYLLAQREQRAADAAAIAGAVYLPAQPDLAKATAEEVLRRNNVDPATASIYPVPAEPGHLYVDVKNSTQTAFLQIIGITKFNITRHAVGFYRGPIEMGSPSNVMGNQPGPLDPPSWENPALVGLQQGFFLTATGNDAHKEGGERWTAGRCDPATGIQGLPFIENCNAALPSPQENLDYDGQGQSFIVRVPPGTSGTLAVDAFDPIHVALGIDCQHPFGNPAGQALDPVRYASTAGVYCTGDQWNVDQTTIFTLYTPKRSPGGSQPVAGCSQTFTSGPRADVGAELLADQGSANPLSIYNSFRKWVRLCNHPLGAGESGDFILKVTTGNGDGGRNRFSLRSAILSGGVVNQAASNKLVLFAPGRLQIMVDASPQQNATFYLVNVPPSFKGTKLRIEFFDAGDSRINPLTVLPPVTATDNGTPLTSMTGCTRYRPGNVALSAPSCSIPYITAAGSNGEPSYNGRMGAIDVPIPEGYSCNTAVPEGCWLRVSLTYSAGGHGNDITSWTVKGPGEVLRLTE